MIKIAALISLLFPISLFAKEYEAQIKKLNKMQYYVTRRMVPRELLTTSTGTIKKKVST